jgi:hypothetical protein
MARKLSKKQIAAGFGGKRRQNSAKKRRKSSASHRPRTKNPARKVITGYGSTVMNPRRKKKRNPSGKTNVVFNRAKKKRNSSASKKRRKNVGGIFALTANPAGGRMATTKRKRKRKSSVARSNAGRRQAPKKNPGHRPRRRSSNPGQFGGPMEWLTGGAGAVIGAVGAPAITQAVLGTSNTGAMGYLGNAIATALLAVAAGFAAPRQKFLAMGIVFGGAGSIMRRVITDYSLLGSYSSAVGLNGMGDYVMNFNYPIPQYLQPGNNRALTPYGGAPATIPMNQNSAAAAGMGSSLYGNRLY